MDDSVGDSYGGRPDEAGYSRRGRMARSSFRPVRHGTRDPRLRLGVDVIGSDHGLAGGSSARRVGLLVFSVPDAGHVGPGSDQDLQRRVPTDARPEAPCGARLTGARVWPEIWEHIGPLFESVLTTGVPTMETNQELVLERNGYAEECFFTFSFSPLFDRGEIGGVLCVASETTEQIVDHRRLECLSRVQTQLVNSEQVTDVCARVAAALAGSRGRCARVRHLSRGGRRLCARGVDPARRRRPGGRLGDSDRHAPDACGGWW